MLSLSNLLYFHLVYKPIDKTSTVENKMGELAAEKHVQYILSIEKVYLFHSPSLFFLLLDSSISPVKV